VERAVVDETQSCTISAPGGCGTRWIEEFGYMTIPTLAATGFALIALMLALGATAPRSDPPASRRSGSTGVALSSRTATTRFDCGFPAACSESPAR
jgi:hypothetical protein